MDSEQDTLEKPLTVIDTCQIVDCFNLISCLQMCFDADLITFPGTLFPSPGEA